MILKIALLHMQFMWRTFHSHNISVCGLPLGILSYTLVLAPIALGDIAEAQAAVKHIFGGPSFR